MFLWLDLKNPVVVLKIPTMLPSIHLNNEIVGNTSLSFIENGATISINRTYVTSTTCGGCFCDKQRVNEWMNSRGCGCYGVNANRSNLAIIHTVVVEKNGEKKS